MKPALTPASPARPELIAVLIDLELTLMMADLFRAYTQAHPSLAAPTSRVRGFLASATDSGMGVLISILIRQVLVLIASALVIAKVIG